MGGAADARLEADLSDDERAAFKAAVKKRLEAILGVDECDEVLAEYADAARDRGARSRRRVDRRRVEPRSKRRYAVVLVASDRKSPAEVGEAMTEMVGAGMAAELAAWLETAMPGSAGRRGTSTTP